MCITDPEQHLDIGFVRMFSQWISEKKYKIDFAFDQHGGDLSISAQRTGIDQGDIRSCSFEMRAGSCSGEKVIGHEKIFVLQKKTDQFCLFSIVGDECDRSEEHTSELQSRG